MSSSHQDQVPDDEGVPVTAPGNKQNSSPPWQYEWKRPQWQVVQDGGTGEGNNDVKEGTCISMTSAHVTGNELPDCIINNMFPDDTTTSQETQQPLDHATTTSGNTSNHSSSLLSSSLVLTVTIVASPFCPLPTPTPFHEPTVSSAASVASATTNSTSFSTSNLNLPPPSGDLLVLEIVQQPGPTEDDALDAHDSDGVPQKDPTKDDDDEQEMPPPSHQGAVAAEPQRILYKVLRWPGVALQETILYPHQEQDEESNNNNNNKKNWRKFLPSWLGGIPQSRQRQQQQQQHEYPTNSTVGVVAACLCRRLEEEDKQQAAALDALDTMTFLSLGMDPDMDTTNTKEKALTRNTKDDNTDTNNAGEVDEDTKDDNQQEKNMNVNSSSEPIPELVLACLCSDGSIHVYSPWKLLERSLSANAKCQHQQQKHQVDDVFGYSMSAFLLGDYVFQQLQSNIWPLSQPEATIKLTIPMQKQHDKTNNNDHWNQQTTNTPTNTTAEEDERKTDGGGGGTVSLWDRSIWDPNVDPFTAIYRTESNMPTLCISAFEYITIAGRGKRVKRFFDNNNNSNNNNATAPRRRRPKTVLGGFITLLSLRHYSEVRTLYLPFVPTRISAFKWGGMKFLFVLGDGGIAVAIRIDISIHNSVICGEAPSISDASHPDPNEPIIPTVSSDQSLLSHQSSRSITTERNNNSKHKNIKLRCYIHRFQILPIILPDTIADDTQALSVALATLFGSSSFTCPPRLALVCQNPTNKNSGLVVQRTLESVDYFRPSSNSPLCRLFRGYRRSRDRRILVISTAHDPRHFARITPPPSSSLMKVDSSVRIEGSKDEQLPPESVDLMCAPWCHVGQGWCLVGSMGRIYFICWDGATASSGAFVQELQSTSAAIGYGIDGLISDMLPINPYATQKRATNHYEGLALPFTQDAATKDTKLRRAMSVERHKHAATNESIHSQEDPGMDEVVKEAIRSISMLDLGDNALGSQRTRNGRRYSHREKSVRLLRKCPTWSQLENSRRNKIRLEERVPSVNVRLQNDANHPCVLTVRRMYADNGVATPFDQILSWLSNKKDYFTAASVALDLLRDAGTLMHLWKSFDMIDDADDERTRLEGLLDGIVPIQNKIETTDKKLNDESFPKVQSTLMQLADMTVGCLTRGGFQMSSTLEYFLKQNEFYDASRTCLVCAATATQAVSDDDEAEMTAMGDKYKRPDDNDQFIQDLLWPVRCLLQVGIARDKLSSALALINAAIPAEIRRQHVKKRVDSMKLCVAIVKLIIGSSPDATGLLLDLVDEQDGNRFWYSLDHDTQLELALVLIDGNCPLLQQLEIRNWALHYLQTCLQQGASSGSRNFDDFTSDWLKNLCSVCLVNAHCDIGSLTSPQNFGTEIVYSDDGLKEHVQELTLTREALIGGHNSGRLDYNLLIPALLLLDIRDIEWNDESWVSTQSLLNAACDLAGRVTAEEPLFALDGNTLMMQCYLAGNICAGANLVGGKNGLTLECCSILIEYCDMSMENAENFLLQEKIKVPLKENIDSSESERVAEDFVLGNGHRHVLWLLNQHVLRIRTYGEFDPTPARGKVDPVFAARACLRTWYCMTRSQLRSASAWLATWLREQLGIMDDCVSKKRLACAALSRVLFWSAGLEEGSVLAEHMKLETRFLVQLSQACWNLVESSPENLE